jgi:flavodoxin
MKTLIVYFSKSGKNKKLAEEIQGKISGRLEEILEEKPKKGLVSFIFGGLQAMLKREAAIIAPKADPSNYDLTVIVSPIWTGHLPPATRRYLKRMRDDLNKFAYLSVCGNGEKNGPGFTEDLVKTTGKIPVAMMLILEKDFEKEVYKEDLDELLEKLVKP